MLLIIPSFRFSLCTSIMECMVEEYTHWLVYFQDCMVELEGPSYAPSSWSLLCLFGLHDLVPKLDGANKMG